MKYDIQNLSDYDRWENNYRKQYTLKCTAGKLIEYCYCIRFIVLFQRELSFQNISTFPELQHVITECNEITEVDQSIMLTTAIMFRWNLNGLYGSVRKRRERISNVKVQISWSYVHKTSSARGSPLFYFVRSTDRLSTQGQIHGKQYTFQGRLKNVSGYCWWNKTKSFP
jgi:hypothetical protein